MTLATITYKTDHDANIDGTRLFHRNVKASYHRLVELFGEPERIGSHDEGDHARISWTVEFSDDEILTIYDWNDDRAIYNVDEWNIGGRNFMATSRIFDILKGQPIYA